MLARVSSLLNDQSSLENPTPSPPPSTANVLPPNSALTNQMLSSPLTQASSTPVTYPPIAHTLPHPHMLAPSLSSFSNQSRPLQTFANPSTHAPFVPAPQTSTSTTLSRLFHSPYPRSRVRRSSLFNKPVCGPWEHVFFGCALRSTDAVPSAEETLILQRNGLGRKVIQFPVNGSAADVKVKIEEAFTALRGIGGFKIMRCCRSRKLIDLPVPAGGYTVSYLKEDSGLNRAVAYVVPLQSDLILMAEEEDLSQKVRYIENNCCACVIDKCSCIKAIAPLQGLWKRVINHRGRQKYLYRISLVKSALIQILRHALLCSFNRRV